jgi:hypothetical protein
MPNFSNGKVTTNAIFYDRGVPLHARNFGSLVSINYEMLKQLYLYEKTAVSKQKNRDLLKMGFPTNKK